MTDEEIKLAERGPLLDPRLEEHHGWTRIGAVCSSNRRSVWMRLVYVDEGLTDEAKQQRQDAGFDPNRPLIDDASTVERIELRGGREGTDEGLIIDRSNPQFAQLLSLFCLFRFVAQE